VQHISANGKHSAEVLKMWHTLSCKQAFDSCELPSFSLCYMTIKRASYIETLKELVNARHN